MRHIRGHFPPTWAEANDIHDVAKAPAIPVTTYRELMEKVAQLAYFNKDHLLFFRGQHSDYLNKAGASSFYPSIYRGDRVSQKEINNRFENLNNYSSKLSEAFKKHHIVGHSDLTRRR